MSFQPQLKNTFTFVKIQAINADKIWIWMKFNDKRNLK